MPASSWNDSTTMYHDQGQIAMELMGFERGVTVQGGLPVAITTPSAMMDTQATRVLSREDFLYPPIVPHHTGRLALDGVHTMYWEESGNPRGIPVVFLHGGPGGGS